MKKKKRKKEKWLLLFNLIVAVMKVFFSKRLASRKKKKTARGRGLNPRGITFYTGNPATVSSILREKKNINIYTYGHVLV